MPMYDRTENAEKRKDSVPSHFDHRLHPELVPRVIDRDRKRLMRVFWDEKGSSSSIFYP